MTPLPSGTVTFLFTDIEGSTQRWDAFPDAMREALKQHDVLMRQAIEAREGHVFKTVGDAFCAAFATAGAGIAAAIDAQRAIAAEDWSAFGEGFAPILVRMGIHTGEASERDGDYFGQPVNRVARLEAAGHGGQVLVSDASYNIAREQLPAGFSLVDRGEHRLKDLRHSEHIFQLQGPGLPAIDTPPTTAEALHVRDRVRVSETEFGTESAVVESDARDAQDNPWSRLEAALRTDEGDAVTLTPAEARDLARHKPADWREYHLGRIAEWSQARYRLDGRFVGLTLLVDQGEEAAQGRWAAEEKRFGDLRELVEAGDHPAIVVLGPPGGGKSTLLRRLELDNSIRELRDEGQGRVTFFISLNTYKPEEPGQALPAPGRWLETRWAARAPDLPALDTLLAEGRVTLLLDALNEMPAAGEADFHERVSHWKDWLQRLMREHPDNRVIFSCRSLDYSQSLSTPDLRVPQVRIEPLTDAQVKSFLELYSPAQSREVWQVLEGSPQLDVLRSPYFLALLVEQVEATGEMPAGRAALFTGFVRQALRREVDRGFDHFKPGTLLSSRDLKRLANWKWKSPFDLPERGILVPKLSSLAHAMQVDRAEGERSQVRIDVDDALDMLDAEEDEAILAAGAALAVLDEDQAAEELMYIHQLVQEYFAARQLAKSPEPELVRAAWRADEVQPALEQVVAALDPGDSLPPLPSTGWEETMILAAAMTKDPEAFLRGLMDQNLVVAGRAAAQPELLPRLPELLLDALRWALAERSCDPAADLRERLACGQVLGELGDPRYEKGTGPDGPYLLPPLVEIPGGTYSIGGDGPLAWDHPIIGQGASVAHVPRHELEIEGFRLGQFQVTNAEWACFVEAGGYTDERWWETEDARAWLRGDMLNQAGIDNNRDYVEKIKADPELLERMQELGGLAKKDAEQLRHWSTLDEENLERELTEKWRGKPVTEPHFSRDPRFNGGTQPALGVSWYEARAYCAWLSAQSGLQVRLPSEVEWEAAAGGPKGRRFAFGEDYDPLRCNMLDTHLHRPSPVGVFPQGNSPEGVADMVGNVREWMSSALGEDEDERMYGYPYEAYDGREDPTLPPSVRRILRGGSWHDMETLALSAFREHDPPGEQSDLNGFRVVASPISTAGLNRSTPHAPPPTPARSPSPEYMDAHLHRANPNGHRARRVDRS